MRVPKNKLESRTGITLPDIIALFMMLAIFVALLIIASHWLEPLKPNQNQFDLSLLTLPRATFFSIARIAISYVISLFLAITIGYFAAHSPAAERFIIPLVDILQSVPKFGFLPGSVLVFISIFPTTNAGLELSAILMIVVSMVWNLLLSFYSSIKSIPREYSDVMRAYRYSKLGTLLRLEIPYAINGLIWNSMLSVAAGWFFLTICESFTLGEQSFKLVGLGSYMAYAAEFGDYRAMFGGCGIMILTLFVTDLLVWRPLLRWAERFQGSTGAEDEDDAEDMISFFGSSRRITRFVRRLRRYYSRAFYAEPVKKAPRAMLRKFRKFLSRASIVGLGIFLVWTIGTAILMIYAIPSSEWNVLLVDAFFTCLRVLCVIFVSSLMMIPFGLWLGSQRRLTRRFRPVIQVIAAFPAPMIFPLITSAFLSLHIPISISSIAMMMFGAQWFLLFNVIAGASQVPREFVEVAKTAGMSNWQILRKVYLPASMPYIVTGWLTAAGGAWNASIVSEIVMFRGKQYVARGIGSYIAAAAGNQKYAELVAAVGVMVIVIVFINRFLWARLYNMVESRFTL